MGRWSGFFFWLMIIIIRKKQRMGLLCAACIDMDFDILDLMIDNTEVYLTGLEQMACGLADGVEGNHVHGGPGVKSLVHLRGQRWCKLLQPSEPR